MQITVFPSRLKGKICPPPSKSAAIRAIVCALYCKNPVFIKLSSICDDVSAALDCAESIGAKIRYFGGGVTIEAPDVPNTNAVLNVRESAACFNFFSAYAASVSGDYTLKLSPSLFKREHGEILYCLSQNGCKITDADNEVHISGRLDFSNLDINSSFSSQPISAILMAAAGNSPCRVTAFTSVSKPYVLLTLEILKAFGTDFEVSENTYTFKEKKLYAESFEPLCDLSAAAYFEAANLIGSDVQITGVRDRFQADGAVREIFKRFKSEKERQIYAADIPDSVPIIAAVSAGIAGNTVIYDINRLKSKESDRIASVIGMIGSIGGDAKHCGDAIIINGKKLCGGVVDSQNDHRIAMSAAIAALMCENPVTVLNAECVGKSYPNFWKDFKMLGGVLNGEIL